MAGRCVGRLPGGFSVSNGRCHEDVEKLMAEDFGLTTQKAEGGHGAGDFHPPADVVQQLVKEEPGLSMRSVGIFGDGGIQSGAPSSVVQ